MTNPRMIELTSCRDCPHRDHKGAFGNPASIPYCKKTREELPFTLNSNVASLDYEATPPDWCPLPVLPQPDTDRPAPYTWQPIETVSKDQLVDILLTGGVRWCDCYHDRITDTWRTSRPSGKLLSIAAEFVTHWMPRRSAPKHNGE